MFRRPLRPSVPSVSPSAAPERRARSAAPERRACPSRPDASPGRPVPASASVTAGRTPTAGAPARDPGRPVRYRNELISIVSSRPGPTPIAEIGAPDISSRALTYACAFFGRSEKDFALVMSSLQPGSVS